MKSLAFGDIPFLQDAVSVIGYPSCENAHPLTFYIIPVPVIKHFIAGVEESGKYAGFCSMGLTCQRTENSQLREHFRMHPDMSVLKKDDILLSFDGVRIANDGTETKRNCSIKVLRQQQRLLRGAFPFSLLLSLEPLVPVHQFDKLPSYFIFAGLVFVPLTQRYLEYQFPANERVYPG
ncbi:hypothetical protein Leryth_006161 [Lithospermum erythrorhizon]|nr:hypothetical protein Leryth_006161 [Lithospermum erythrorhizon]